MHDKTILSNVKWKLAQYKFYNVGKDVDLPSKI